MTKGIHDAKNPYASPVKVARELFQVGGDRNCDHVELDIEGSGITYQHGNHVGVWPLNPNVRNHACDQALDGGHCCGR
jgi:NADPH-ferrihemoprotein reductase